MNCLAGFDEDWVNVPLRGGPDLCAAATQASSGDRPVVVGPASRNLHRIAAQSQQSSMHSCCESHRPRSSGGGSDAGRTVIQGPVLRDAGGPGDRAGCRLPRHDLLLLLETLCARLRSGPREVPPAPGAPQLLPTPRTVKGGSLGGGALRLSGFTVGRPYCPPSGRYVAPPGDVSSREVLPADSTSSWVPRLPGGPHDSRLDGLTRPGEPGMGHLAHTLERSPRGRGDDPAALLQARKRGRGRAERAGWATLSNEWSSTGRRSMSASSLPRQAVGPAGSRRGPPGTVARVRCP